MYTNFVYFGNDQRTSFSILLSPESRIQNFDLPYMIFACFGRYMSVVYSQGGCIKNKAKSSKWPPFKMAPKILKYMELSDKHTYLELNYI